jgi:hypothetical protein
MSKKHAITLAVLATVLCALTAAPAHAQRGITTHLGIYDADNKYAGAPQADRSVV